ncbi:SpoIID/LytB domain-containing protein [Actinomadura gamaensis]|uniref:SpoIID/LytB domain-containing protein n=1 Tax=Actinomadura gamaensis TaxID=1763541 RepID=A0ABV9TZK0_9ACTN
MSKRTTRALSVAAAAMTLGGAVIATAAPAMAAGRNGVCDPGEFCYYFNSGEKGSVSDFTGSVADYGAKQPSCYDFKGPGAGKGICVKNNAASVWNRSNVTVRVYYNSRYGGRYQDVRAGARGNLDLALKNQNASHQFMYTTPPPPPPPPNSCKTDGSNTRVPSSILVYRTGLHRVDRVDFRTYVKNVLPNEWVSSWPRESLRAGAMAVKNYGWYWAMHSTRKTSWGQCFDVYDSTSSQVYRPGSATASTNSAVDATWGTRMTRSGSIFQAQYCSTSSACGAWRDGEWMSQFGSRDKANAGWNFASILRYYYRGIVVS